MAAYLSGALPSNDRASFEAHLADCRTCRGQVTSARRLLATHRTRRPLVWAVPLAAAAMLAWLVFLPSPRQGPPMDALRGRRDSTGADAAAALRVITPANRDTLDRARVAFLWHSAPGQPLFRLTLSDGTGKELWSAETRDTTLVLPTTVFLDPGHTYFWYVDGLGADGRSLTTRTQRFSTRR
jgi:Putative zinc-finger